MKKNSKNWIPEICYEEDSNIPFINVPDGEEDPALLFIFVNRATGEFEPGSKGEELPVMEMDLRQFADMKILKERLPESAYDEVRKCFGLQPLKEAAAAGKAITAKVAKNVGGDHS
jgi:hypothetical protein